MMWACQTVTNHHVVLVLDTVSSSLIYRSIFSSSYMDSLQEFEIIGVRWRCLLLMVPFYCQVSSCSSLGQSDQDSTTTRPPEHGRSV